MSTIIVRAPDSAQAMDEVMRRLGDNAYILSTVHKDGQVEMHASRELPQAGSKAAAPAEPDQSFAAIFTSRRGQGQQASAPRSLTDAPAEDVAPATDAVLTPDPVHRLGGWPGLTEQARADLRQSLLRTQPDPRSLRFLDRIALRLLGAPAALPERVVVVGPSGSGKSMVAARLAGLMMDEDRRRRPLLVSPRLGALAPDETLRKAARLMGLLHEHPLLRDLMIDPLWDRPAPGQPQIIDLSGVPDASPELVGELVARGNTLLVLALPAGMHPGIVAAQCRKWQALSPELCLTRLDDWNPSPEELGAISATGLRLGWISGGRGIVDAITRPDWSHLSGWAERWLAAEGGDA